MASLCNACTIAIATYLVYKLSRDIKFSKSNSAKRKIPLLKWSMAFVLCFVVNTIDLVIVPYVPKWYPYCDALMQIFITVGVFCYFRQWEQNMYLMIQNRFTLML